MTKPRIVQSTNFFQFPNRDSIFSEFLKRNGLEEKRRVTISKGLVADLGDSGLVFLSSDIRTDREIVIGSPDSGRYFREASYILEGVLGGEGVSLRAFMRNYNGDIFASVTREDHKPYWFVTYSQP